MSEKLELSISSQETTVLDLPPCCIEFSPFHKRWFVIGTYFLERKDENGNPIETIEDGWGKQLPERTGSIEVYQVDPEAEKTTLIQTSFQPSAILDLHFHQEPTDDGSALLVAVTSTGTITFHHLNPTVNPAIPLIDVATQRLDSIDKSTLILFCAWHSSDPSLLGITTSDGRALLVRVNLATAAITGSRELPIANDLENWFIALTPSVETMEGSKVFSVLSGGDDSGLRWTSCVYDSDASVDDEDLGLELPYGAAVLRNQHMAGVTAIVPLPIQIADGSMLLLTGSYDDTIRLFAWKPLHETYGMRSCRLLTEENLGGGVWRIKQMKETMEDGDARILTFLVSCMYAGTRIVRLRGSDDGETWEFEVIAKFEGHKSMNYGSEVVPEFDYRNVETGLKEKLAISTSFYDKLMCVWRSPV